MKFLVSLAWKNLSRYKRRTVITMIAIAFGISMYIWIDGFLLGMEKESERNLLWYETGVAEIM
ncbi:MAG: ABC transporter permease, partial [Spirochaetales bacterium]|nr:ABC transporter permease [Spirochaetales bacterium]